MKYLLGFIILFTSMVASASIHFNVTVGKDFNSPFNDSFDSVYFQSTGSAVTVEKVVVSTKTGTCELFVEIEPTRFNWGKRWSMPMWSCKQEDIVSVAIYTKRHIYTYNI